MSKKVVKPGGRGYTAKDMRQRQRFERKRKGRRKRKMFRQRPDDRKDFIDSVIHQDLLDIAIEWIQKYLDVEQVFDREVLKEWAENNGYRKGE